MINRIKHLDSIIAQFKGEVKVSKCLRILLGNLGYKVDKKLAPFEIKINDKVIQVFYMDYA